MLRGVGQRHHPHFDTTPVARGTGYKLKVFGNELDGFTTVELHRDACGSVPALHEILHEKLGLGVVESVALRARSTQGWSFVELNDIEDLPASGAVLRIRSNCTGSIRYPGLQPFHHFPYNLHDAAQAGDSTAVGKLVARGARSDERVGCGAGRTPLHHACVTGRAEVVRQLLEASRNSAARGEQRLTDALHATDSMGRTPLHYAARNGHTEIVLQLLLSDADSNMTKERELLGLKSILINTSVTGATPLHEAAGRTSGSDVVQVLCDAGAPLTATDDRGRGALHWAAEIGNTEAVQILLACVKRDEPSALQVLCNMADKKQITSMHLACGR